MNATVQRSFEQNRDSVRAPGYDYGGMW